MFSNSVGIILIVLVVILASYIIARETLFYLRKRKYNESLKKGGAPVESKEFSSKTRGFAYYKKDVGTLTNYNGVTYRIMSIRENENKSLYYHCVNINNPERTTKISVNLVKTYKAPTNITYSLLTPHERKSVSLDIERLGRANNCDITVSGNNISIYMRNDRKQYQIQMKRNAPIPPGGEANKIASQVRNVVYKKIIEVERGLSSR